MRAIWLAGGLVLGLAISVGAQDTTTLLSAFLGNLRNGVIQLTGTTFTNLGTPSDGTLKYCSDCTFANPCADSGTGAIAKRLAGAWRCD